MDNGQSSMAIYTTLSLPSATDVKKSVRARMNHCMIQEDGN